MSGMSSQAGTRRKLTSTLAFAVDSDANVASSDSLIALNASLSSLLSLSSSTSSSPAVMLCDNLEEPMLLLR